MGPATSQKRFPYLYLFYPYTLILPLYFPKKYQSIKFPRLPQTQTQTQMKQTPLYRPSGGPNSGLTRYGSAPGSLLTSLADSVISEGPGGFHSVIRSASGSESPATLPMTRFFPGPGDRSNNNSRCCISSSESSCGKDPVGPSGLQLSNYPVGEISGAGGDNNNQKAAAGGGVGGSGAHLLRQSSSPAGFFSHLMVDNGFSVTRGMGHYSQPASNGVHTTPHTRLNSQLSFSRQEPLSQISEIIPEMGESVVGGNSSDENGGSVGQSYISSNYSIGSWDDTNSIAFSAPSSKRAKDSSEDLLTSLSHIDSQFSLPTSLEMAAVEKLFQAQQDSVAFKVRAKRGCATHPRSIAERDRRTRISEKLRKLQELVPNMDKQTSTADMLDLALQHVKDLQRQIQDLNQERATCTCACKDEFP